MDIVTLNYEPPTVVVPTVPVIENNGDMVVNNVCFRVEWWGGGGVGVYKNPTPSPRHAMAK